MKPLIVLRPAPGSARTVARARDMGLTVRCHPLFAARALPWTAVAADRFDALLLTSAQAATLAGPGLAAYRALPAYAVGEATAQALRAQGFDQVVAGTGDGSAIAGRIAADGHRALLHLAGASVAPFEHGPLSITRIAVYAMIEAEASGLDAIAAPSAVMLVHSARAGERLAGLIHPADRGTMHIVGISAAAVAACGTGWASAQAPENPDDTAMLALAARLCK